MCVQDMVYNSYNGTMWHPRRPRPLQRAGVSASTWREMAAPRVRSTVTESVACSPRAHRETTISNRAHTRLENWGMGRAYVFVGAGDLGEGLEAAGVAGVDRAESEEAVAGQQARPLGRRVVRNRVDDRERWDDPGADWSKRRFEETVRGDGSKTRERGVRVRVRARNEGTRART